MNNNYIQTTIISIIIALFIGLLFNAIAIAPVAAEAEVTAIEAAQPISINAKRAIALNTAVECLQEDQDLINQVFAKTFNDNNFKFQINNKLVSHKYIIKTNLNDIKNMIKVGDYDKASKSIKEYKYLLHKQVRDTFIFLPTGQIFKCLVNADNLGVDWYFEN